MLKNKIKLVAVDLDDTLLDANKGISGRNFRAIKQVLQKGVIFTFATGRSYTVVNKYAQCFDITAPLVTTNGAFIRWPGNGKILDAQLLQGEVLKEFFLFSKEHAYDLVAVKDGKLIAEKKITWLDKFFNTEKPLAKKRVQEDEDYIQPIATAGEYLVEILGNDFYEKIDSVEKILMVIDGQRIYESEKLLREKFAGRLYGAISKEPCLEVMLPLANKGRGVSLVADYYGIKQEEIMCIGDSFNDLEMIEYAGLGVVVGDGADRLKELADFVTAKHDEDGVAKALEKFIL